MSSCFFCSTSTSVYSNIHKHKNITRNGIILATNHESKCNDHQPKPKSYIWIKNCLSVSICGTIISLSFISFNPNAEAVSYPCQDVQAYYSGTEGLSGYVLKKKLGSIVYKHNSLPYKLVWEALKILIQPTLTIQKLHHKWLRYIHRNMYQKNWQGGQMGGILLIGEHLWPRSYGLKNAPSLTDLHNLRPADANVNSSRGNKYFGECTTDVSTRCLRPAYKEAASDTETDKYSWAPPLQVRGDIARSVLYMAVCYGFIHPHLQVSDTPNLQRREMGMLSTLVQWNELDPPSREAKLRNDRIWTRDDSTSLLC